MWFGKPKPLKKRDMLRLIDTSIHEAMPLSKIDLPVRATKHNAGLTKIVRFMSSQGAVEAMVTVWRGRETVDFLMIIYSGHTWNVDEVRKYMIRCDIKADVTERTLAYES